VKIALVTPEYSSRPGVIERHVRHVAEGLARRGAAVEVLTQDGVRGPARDLEADGVLVRRFVRPAGNRRVLVSPGLWDHLHRGLSGHDLVHLHGAHPGLGFALARACAGRLVFTPHAPIEQLSGWSHGRLLRAIVERASLSLCASRSEADLLRRAVPAAASRVSVVPNGVDVAGIRAATPLPHTGSVVLTVGRLERCSGVTRAIAAMASLEPSFRLVVVGDGPARDSLKAYAADLDVGSRVLFTGAVPDGMLYRWLRTATVVVALAERQASGVQMLEAVSAGAPVVASATPTHREIAAYLEERGVALVSKSGSPLEVADAISQLAGARPRPDTQAEIPSWEAVAQRTGEIYGRLVAQRVLAGARRWGVAGRVPRLAYRPRPTLRLRG
jgi:glycosyltransferase involved in cell wall biosynthesis